MDKFPSNVIVTPVDATTDPSTFINALVVACPLDDPYYRHDRYLGTVTAVKTMQRGGVYVRFITDDSHGEALVGSKWIAVNRIRGFASYAWKATA
jgi:hypothetical protein